jgi:hypothetical protein
MQSQLSWSSEMTRSERVFACLLASAAIAALGACDKRETPKLTSAVEDPATMVARENREIAERLAQQKLELEGKNAEARAALDLERARETRQKHLATFQSLYEKWKVPYGEAGLTRREEIGPVIAKMEAVKSEVQSVKTDECIDKALATLTSAMGQVIDAYKAFQQEKGQPSDAVRKKLNDTYQGIDQANADAQACAQ